MTMPPVAHAGGAYNGLSYTNSLEALNANYQKGFRYFEIDLQRLADGKIICAHDVMESTPSSSKPKHTVTVPHNAGYTSCTLATLTQWLYIHPDARLITDVKKESQMAVLSALAKHAGTKQMIPQIYDPSEYDAVKKLGYTNIILTLYRYKGENAALIEFTRNHALYAVTMPTHYALQGKALRMQAPIYIHTVNTCSSYKLANLLGANGFYTDTLSTGEC